MRQLFQVHKLHRNGQERRGGWFAWLSDAPSEAVGAVCGSRDLREALVSEGAAKRKHENHEKFGRRQALNRPFRVDVDCNTSIYVASVMSKDKREKGGEAAIMRGGQSFEAELTRLDQEV